ncbi:HAD family hydrolase [Noviherbaspirillum saxi]|uniref:Hydrolase n=1 Tax=Noviherbaspirillum saxi TaxID=2320863 RepID=A0A3A3FPA5_9BURK|nr:HAD family hydrolase [Noviherbaspirillum saxi]RJF95519.1 hydrolase [Noviherbaspirillum saxi]
MDIRAITFDYFGTLVDVDKGGIIGMEKVLNRIGIKPSKGIDEIYLDWDINNVRLYRGEKYQRYRDVAQRALVTTLDAIAPGISKQIELPFLTDLFLSNLVEEAPPHPEVPAVLAWMASRYPLMPITNMDTDLWQRSQLTQYFEHVTSAEMAKAYKPSSDIFKLALQRLAVPAENVLHCSLASWADIDGAKPLGMNVAWINRGRDVLGTWQPRPDFEYHDLSSVRILLENEVPSALKL